VAYRTKEAVGLPALSLRSPELVEGRMVAEWFDKLTTRKWRGVRDAISRRGRSWRRLA
jgi:predicted small integral membrane protein